MREDVALVWGESSGVSPSSLPTPHPPGKSETVSKRILIMMSNTGGGHKASADAIKAGFQEKYGDAYEVSHHQNGGMSGEGNVPSNLAFRKSTECGW